jgi:hypothetical protein
MYGLSSEMILSLGSDASRTSLGGLEKPFAESKSISKTKSEDASSAPKARINLISIDASDLSYNGKNRAKRICLSGGWRNDNHDQILAKADCSRAGQQ